MSKLRSLLESKIPKSVLDVSPFGRSKVEIIWVEVDSLEQVAKFLKEECDFEHLENFSAAEMDDAIVLSYFVRSAAKENLVLRATVAIENPEGLVTAPSVQSVWPMVEIFEREAGDLFGIQFVGGPTLMASRFMLPEGWEGYPLRKKYKTPKSFGGVSHSTRNTNN